MRPYRASWLMLLLASSISPLYAQATSSTKQPIVDDFRYTQAQQMVEVAPGRRLNLLCMGQGSPTVVFDAGMGDETAVWGFVQPVIAKLTRTCSYDRAGIGFSDPATRPGTSANIVDDLHNLLVHARIPAPYVLVGHSYGGLNMLLFASRYRSEVVGMVAVDPANERQVDALRQAFPNYDKKMLSGWIAQHQACIKQSEIGFKPGSELYQKCITKPDPTMSAAINAAYEAKYVKPPYQKALASELESVRGGISDEQVRAAHRNFGDMPLIVLTRSLDHEAKAPLRADETKRSRQILLGNWMQMHDELASRSTRGQNRVIADTSHYIQLDQPGAVIAAIEEVLKETPSTQTR
ncbi:alpha/beta hydrolase [Dyella mobilis]|uniref:Alpha/beta hydrolase n=1 Tax=Dyella mobilis TaxID=1849582 RepID=A0ABS2KF66_9GAMM|nr:alpha/beta hydrolase [Dyella mobilis]MBM7129402.1 alpha/beta hydrolase [Dyella mobilis]GLQ98333.1 hypothetical protein GCM10007863_27530 [Dyella mobilis]